MYCIKCGQKLPDDAVFCLKCGTRTINNQAAKCETAPVAEKKSNEKPVSDEAKKNVEHEIHKISERARNELEAKIEAARESRTGAVVVCVIIAVIAAIVSILFGSRLAEDLTVMNLNVCMMSGAVALGVLLGAVRLYNIRGRQIEELENDLRKMRRE